MKGAIILSILILILNWGCASPQAQRNKWLSQYRQLADTYVRLSGLYIDSRDPKLLDQLDLLEDQLVDKEYQMDHLIKDLTKDELERFLKEFNLERQKITNTVLLVNM